VSFFTSAREKHYSVPELDLVNSDWCFPSWDWKHLNGLGLAIKSPKDDFGVCSRLIITGQNGNNAMSRVEFENILN